MIQQEIEDFMNDTFGAPKLSNIQVDIFIISKNETQVSTCDIRYTPSEDLKSIDFTCDWDESVVEFIGTYIFGKFSSNKNKITYDKNTRKLIIISILRGKQMAKITFTIS